MTEQRNDSLPVAPSDGSSDDERRASDPSLVPGARLPSYWIPIGVAVFILAIGMGIVMSSLGR